MILFPPGDSRLWESSENEDNVYRLIIIKNFTKYLKTHPSE